MKKSFFLILLLLVSAGLAYGQETFVNKQYGFSMQMPKKWLVTSQAELNGNLKKFDLTDEELAKFLKDNNNSVLLLALQKYDPKTKKGLIPVIQVTVRTKSTMDFQRFKTSIIKNHRRFSEYFENFEFIEEPKEIEFSGTKSVFLLNKFNIKSQAGKVLNVRSRTYMIPLKDYFFQVNFTDGQDGEDCSAEFDELVKTIKIGR